MDTRRLAKEHEDHIAGLYQGRRSPSSGGSVTDKGDVRSEKTLLECKMTGQPGSPKYATLIRRMEKIADEAWEEGREPAVALRYFCPESVLANHNGWVDLVVRIAKDDAMRELERIGAET